ncbi:glycosyltransferase family 1 protein [Mucilaginibacter pallidiroseus]|uniref:Glycosyltransferase family 1 protein n=1 Tax=Mucilaginibacter pallidiroseus TaxID=2599295 RepID=A0A563UGZ2_9SPHI|nr:glycosyltransferase [Mucilaginibacter pallidiroseus]TWR30637.1 glycosyltransferase family 1 protein [Mucilaginibacter pallidiroseus]
MLNHRNILCISGTEWHGNYIKAVVELMKVLSINNKILFVENPYTYKDAIAGVDGKNKLDFKQVLGFKPRITTFDAGNGGTVNILTPPLTFPVSFLPTGGLFNALLNYNGWLVRRSIRKALIKLGMDKELINFVSFNPSMGVQTAHRFNEQTLIYHCYDEIKGAHPWLSKHGIGLEKTLMHMVDAVIVTSNGLYESKKNECKRCYIVKNAVKADLFIQGFSDNINKGKKVVGYVGSVDNRLDYDLLHHLFTSMPDTEFIFVGRIIEPEYGERLKPYPNVKLEGAKQPEELPAYLKRFSAGIIPFITDDFTRGIYPMKINEYLAAGLPVVSTDFSDLTDFEGNIQVASSNTQFLAHLIAEIDTDTSSKRHARLQLAQGNTWEKRADELSAVIEQVEREIKTAV